jgi:hypothetical protein
MEQDSIKQIGSGKLEVYVRGNSPPFRLTFNEYGKFVEARMKGYLDIKGRMVKNRKELLNAWHKDCGIVGRPYATLIRRKYGSVAYVDLIALPYKFTDAGIEEIRRQLLDLRTFKTKGGFMSFSDENFGAYGLSYRDAFEAIGFMLQAAREYVTRKECSVAGAQIARDLMGVKRVDQDEQSGAL